MSGIRPDMRDHPLTVAARYNDARTEEKGLIPAIEESGLKFEDIMYIAEQRALRVILISIRKEKPKGSEGYSLDPNEQILFELLVTTYLDGLLIGWEGRRLNDAS